jgi:hypothetical protein
VTTRPRVRAARAMAMAMRVVGDEEGNGDADKGGGRATVMATKRVMVTAARVVGE